MRGVLRAFGWTAVGLGSILLGGYGLLLLINARDEPPSTQALHLARVYAQRPAVADADNGFLYVARMGLPTGEGKLPFAEQPAVRALTLACDGDYLQCAQALDDDAAAVASQWLAHDAELLAQYHTLIAFPQWRETVADDPTSLPPYQHAMRGQRLLLMQAWLVARGGDAAGVTLALEQDLCFWRRVLRDSDSLIGKSVAAAAIRQHFGLGNLVMRELGAGRVDSIPAQWHMPLSEEERALERAMAGEWRLVDASIRDMVANGRESADATWLDRLQRPFFKPQASINLAAERYEGLGKASRSPYPELAAAVTRADSPTVRWWQWLFNPAGRVPMVVASGRYGDYVISVADLEGARGAALATATLRARGAALVDMGATIAAADMPRDPYTGQPFAWHAETGAVAFAGHDPRPHLYSYRY